MNISVRILSGMCRNLEKLCLLVMAVALLGQSAFAQTGFTGNFGGGPFYKNAANNITELKNYQLTEAIVWSVEVNSAGDLNFNGEFPLTANGVYIGDQTHADFAANMAALKTGTVSTASASAHGLRRLAGHYRPG